MGHLRLRLRFRNLPPYKEKSSWYLLNQCKLKDVGSFMADVKEKFGIHEVPLRCSIKGFCLPSWESIKIIRDEDELLIEKDDDAAVIRGIQGMEKGQYDARIGCSNKTEHGLVNDVDPFGPQSAKDEMSSIFTANESPLYEKVRHRTKRKHDTANGENLEGSVSNIPPENDKKVKKKRKKKIDVESRSIVTGSHGRTIENRVSTTHHGLPQCFAIDTKNPFKGKKNDSPCVLQTQETVKQNHKEVKDITPDKPIAIKSLEEMKKKAGCSKIKGKNSSTDSNCKPSPNIDNVVIKEMKKIELNLKKTTLHNGSEASKMEEGNERTRSRNNSFQIVSKPFQYGRSSSQLTVKSNLSGNHLHFDSDEEDDSSIKSTPVSGLVDDNITSITSSPFGDCIIPFVSNSNTSVSVAPSKGTHDDKSPLVSKTSPACFQNSDRDQHVNSTKISTESTLSDTTNRQDLEMHDARVGKYDDQDKTYDALTPLQGAPRVGDKIAFKVLEMSLSYTPEISDYKEAAVQEVDKKGIVTLLLADQSKSRKMGDGTLTRKFELESDSEHEDNDTLEIHWKQLIDSKLVTN